MKAEVIKVSKKEGMDVIVKGFGSMKLDLKHIGNLGVKKEDEFEGYVAGGTFYAEKKLN